MLGHLVLVEHGADLDADVGGTAQRLALATDRCGDLGQVPLGCREQVLSLAAALAGEVWIAADDEPLAGEVG